MGSRSNGGGRPAVKVGLSLAAVVAAVPVAILLLGFLATRGDEGSQRTLGEGVGSANGLSTSSTTSARSADPPEVAIIGDSTALHIAFGFGGWTQSTGRARSEGDVIELGCGLLPSDLFTRFRYDGEANSPPACATQEARRAESIRSTDPDVAVVLVGPWEVADWYDDELERWRHIGQADLDEIVKDRIRLMVETLSAEGAVVYWLTSPRIQLGMREGVPPAFDRPASNPLRMQRLNTLVASVAVEYPNVVEILDLAGYLRTTPGGEMDAEVRPDGVHFTWDSANHVAAGWLGPEILRRYHGDTQRQVAPATG